MSTFRNPKKLSSLFELLTKQLSVSKEEIHYDSKFIGDLGADSLDTVELWLDCENFFEAKFPETELEELQTPRDFLRYIANKPNRSGNSCEIEFDAATPETFFTSQNGANRISIHELRAR